MAKGQYLSAFNQTIPPSASAALPTVTYADAMTRLAYQSLKGIRPPTTP
jgi:hypothetical protein